MSGDSGGTLSNLELAKNALGELKNFRDNYFSKHSLDDAMNKDRDVELEVQQTVKRAQKLLENDDSAESSMILGSILNVKSKHDPEAEKLLSRAVKREPRLVEGWTELGECNWKRGDVNAAKDCFEGALSHGKNKVALRNLSMALRQVGNSPEERGECIQKSVEYAKEAVQMDIKDGTSWWVLGNAYLSLFFASNQGAKIIKLCLSAYQQAEKDPVAVNNPDLHFNRAIAHKYQEEYDLALKGFRQAKALDPMWEEPQNKFSSLLAYLKKANDMVIAKGKQRSKKIHDLSKSIKDACLGPYAGGSYSSPLNKTVTLNKALLTDLHVGLNSNLVIVCKVVCSIPQDDLIPYTFCAIDASETCFSVTLYNVDPSYGLNLGDSVAIPEPFVQHIKLEQGQAIIDYQNIRVDTPLVLVVNGRKLGLDKQAPTKLGIDNVQNV